MSALEVIGLLIQILGTALAGEALIADWRQHGQGRPLIPAWARLRARVLRKLGRRGDVAVGAAAGLTVWSGTAAGRAIISLPDDAPLDDQVQWLRARVGQLQDEVDATRGLITEARQQLASQVSQTATELRARHAGLREQLTEVATGRVRQECRRRLKTDPLATVEN